MAQDYVVGLFQNAMTRKAIIDISSTHARLFKKEGGLGDLLCNSEEILSYPVKVHSGENSSHSTQMPNKTLVDRVDKILMQSIARVTVNSITLVIGQVLFYYHSI